MGGEGDRGGSWGDPLGEFRPLTGDDAPSAVAVRGRGTGAAFRGSGFLVASRVVVTAKHVVIRSASPHGAPRDLAPGEAAPAGELVVEDASGARSDCADLVLDSRSDLALIFLARPLAPPLVPLGSAATLGRETVVVCGRVWRDGAVESFRRSVGLDAPEIVGGRPDEALILSATPPGTSGSAVLHGRGMARRIVGLVSLGAEATARGRVVLADRIGEFLAEHDVMPPAPITPCGDAIADALTLDGLPSSVDLTLGGGLRHRMIVLPAGAWIDVDGGRRDLTEPTAISARPLGEDEWVAIGGEGPARRGRLRTDLALTEARARLDRFAARGGVAVRVTTAMESAIAWRVGGARPRPAGGGADGGFAHHVRCRRAFAVPPIGAMEWTATDLAGGEVAVLRPIAAEGGWTIETIPARPTSGRVPFGLRLAIPGRAAILGLVGPGVAGGGR